MSGIQGEISLNYKYTSKNEGQESNYILSWEVVVSFKEN
jgi:hypothetical protein